MNNDENNGFNTPPQTTRKLAPPNIREEREEAAIRVAELVQDDQEVQNVQQELNMPFRRNLLPEFERIQIEEEASRTANLRKSCKPIKPLRNGPEDPNSPPASARERMRVQPLA